MKVSIVQGERGIKSLTTIPKMAVVIIDVFRASTTMVIALEKGARCIFPVKSIKDALELRDEDYLIVGEEHGLPAEGFDHGNSPFEISRISNLKGQKIVMVTTNGTRGILASFRKGFDTYIGCLRNARALTTFLQKRYEHVTLVPMGTNEIPRIEDDACAEIMKAYLLNEPILERTLIEEVKEARLKHNRHIPTWKDDVSLALELNVSKIIPYCQNSRESTHETCIVAMEQQ